MSREPDLYFSFFMFTADLRPNDPASTQVIIKHIRALTELGYRGFDLPIAPVETTDHAAEVASYVTLRRAFDAAGLGDVRFTTNVAATPTFDPTSIEPTRRDAALAYLKSRVDITAALGGEIMAGPIVFPYGVFPTTADNQPIWSDALQEWVVPGYRRARDLLDALGRYAEAKRVKLAIEPVDHWETPAPNLVTDVMRFLEPIETRQIGVCIDSAHVTLGSEGLTAFDREVRHALAEERLHYVHLSAPDRGALEDSWIPWQRFLGPIMPRYGGPFLVEVFNAIPVFLNSLRLTRRRFWIPGEDPADRARPSAYDVAHDAIVAVKRELALV